MNMGVFIEEIVFKNYRQYRDVTVKFDNNDKSKLHVIIARNGTGKTTFLNSVTWCLYGIETSTVETDETKKGKRGRKEELQIINDSVVTESDEDEPVDASVELKIKDIDAGRYINFRRTLSHTIVYDVSSKTKKAIENRCKLEVSITEIGSKTNSKIYSNEEADLIVDQYFDRMIREYYFFDGENLQNFFATSSNVKDAIFNISQLTLLDNTRESCEAIRKQKFREVNKNNPDATKLEKRREELYAQLEEENRIVKESQRKLPTFEKEKAKADEILDRSKSVQAYRDRQKKCLKDEERIKGEMDDFRKVQNAFIQKYLVLLNFYPRIKKTYDMINKKIKAKEIPAPTPYNREILEKLLSKHDPKCHCPVCDTLLNEKAYKYIKSLLDDHDSVSQNSSHILTSLQGPLSSMIKEVENYQNEKRALEEREKYLKHSLNEVQTELINVNSYLSGNAGGDLEERVKQAGKDSLYYGEQIDKAKKVINMNNAYHERDLKDYLDIKEELEKHNENLKIQSNTREKMDVFADAVDAFDTCKQNIMSTMKDEIQKSTWEMFDSMIWKKHTFKNVTINDEYEVSVFNMQNRVMTGSLSATEKMALAYSFTLAIHEASGRNCPLVVDSPLGRVSDTNREKMAAALLDVSKEKQIILLFTPDEYSKDVQKVLVDKASSIKKIELSNDEKEIKEVK